VRESGTSIEENLIICFRTMMTLLRMEASLMEHVSRCSSS